MLCVSLDPTRVKKIQRAPAWSRLSARATAFRNAAVAASDTHGLEPPSLNRQLVSQDSPARPRLLAHVASWDTRHPGFTVAPVCAVCANLSFLVQPLLQPFPFPPGCRAQAWRYQPKYRRPLHFHAEPELNLVWRGRAQFVVGKQSFWVERGGLLVLPPGVDHALVEASPDLEFFAIGFHPELLDAYAQGAGKRFGFGVACKQLPTPVVEPLSDLCGGLGETPDRSVVEHVLREPLEYAMLADERACPSNLSLGMRAASLVLSEGSIRRRDLAKALASNQGDVSRYFTQHNGITLREFRRRVRVLQFLKAVDADPGNLARAAHISGFGSYSQCHRDFCSVIGVSPRKFLMSGQRQAVADRFEPLLPALRL